MTGKSPSIGDRVRPSGDTLLVRLRKLARFTSIYGPRRTLMKALGRTRWGSPKWLGVISPPRLRDVGIIGCGQFGFATIGYFLLTATRHGFAACYDPDSAAATSLARFFGIPSPAVSAETVIADPTVKLVYIASNHATHTPYALAALAADKDVYVEKPLCVDEVQFAALFAALATSKARLYVGYNRPFAPATRILKEWCAADKGPLTMTATIACHVLGPDHWYRDPLEGTRICGNAGHWLDYFVHILSWRGLPKSLNLVIAPSAPAEPDDNLAITLTSDLGDLFSLTMTSRSEPFDGIQEHIVVQWGETLARIDDFRAMTIARGARRRTYRFWPKNVGHKAAILQPITNNSRDLREVRESTRLMLTIAAMVRSGTRNETFAFDCSQVTRDTPAPSRSVRRSTSDEA